MTITKNSAAAPPQRIDVQPRRRTASWGGRILVLLVLGLTGLGWLAPQILSQFIDRPQVLKLVAPDLPENVRVGSAQLSWQAPVLLKDVSVVGSTGEKLVTVNSVTSEQTLWDLIKDVNLPLTLHLEGMSATIVMPEPSADGAINLDTLAESLSQGLSRLINLKSPRVARAMTVQIQGGVIRVQDIGGNELTRFEPVAGECFLRPTIASPAADDRGKLQLTLPVAHPPGEGRCTVTADWNLPAQSDQPGDLRGELALSKIPVDGLSPLTQAVLDGGRLTGTLDGTTSVKLARGADVGLQADVFLDLGNQTDTPTPTLYVVNPAANQLPVPFFLQSARSEVSLRHDPQIDQLDCSKLLFESAPLDLLLQGRVTDLQGMMQADISGSVRCDIQELYDLMPERIRSQVQVDGLQLSEVAFRGPLRPAPVDVPENLAPENPSAATARTHPAVSLQAKLGWNRALAYGLESPAGQLRLNLEQNRLLIEPVNVTLNEGRLRSLPVLELQPAGDHVLHARSGVILENVKLTEELCRGWIRFVSPVMSRATSVSGTISIATGDGIIPVNNLAAGNLQGTLTIGEGQLRGGPMMEPILQSIGQIQTIVGLASSRFQPTDLKLDMVPQQVPFALHDGRVYHSEILYKLGDVRLSGAGSVGLDETLELALHVSMPDRWFENRGPVLSSLKGEQIVVAVRGTLDNPQADLRPLAEFGKRIGARAAGGLIFDLIERGIERRQQRGRP